MKAASGYTGGAWDTNPAEATITGATTFTYTFTALPTYQVTYRVVNGTWSDDTTADKTETVQSGSKPASVPTGMKAASGYTGGAWDTDPTDATITGATTFTYTFTALPSYQVTYKVVNGTWSDYTTTDKTETVQSGSTPASVPTGMKASQGFTGGAWDENPADATITGAKTFTYTFTAKQASTVTKAPTAKNLTYTGSAQELVTAGTASGGEMQYALGTATEATKPYTTSIPAKTDAGTYYVWYKVVGDENHNDTEPACVEVTINKANPIYTAPADLTATYGDTLADVALPKGWAWVDGTHKVGNAGTNTFKAAFTPADTNNYNVVENIDVTVTVAKADPTCTAPTGLTAAYGQTLADVTLTNPNGNTAGTWAWSDSRTSVGSVGTNTFKASFVPTDTTNYNTKTDIDVSVTVGKADPTYTVPTGLTATYGDTLSTVTLPTGWAWADGTQSVGNAGTNTFKANFTPTDTNNYNTVSDVDVSVTVGKADPTYTVPTGLTATYGDTLSTVTLPTGWAWVDGTLNVGGIGTNTFKANFTPADTANYNAVSNVDVSVTVGKAAGKEAVISTDTMSYDSESVCLEGVAGQEYIIVPKGAAVSDADWNSPVKPDPERDNWVFFEDLNAATEYEIYTRTAETETTFAGEAVKANVYTTLSSIGYLYDSTLVGASITVEPDPDVEGLTYKWYQDDVTEDGEGAIHHNLTEIPGASGSSYTFREEDAGKRIAVKIFAGDSEVGDVATDTPVALTAKVIFESNGGSDVETLTDAAYQSKIKAPADPTREGFAFDGWYWDEEFETPFDFEKDVITWTETTLYAKWTPNDYKITSVTGLTGANNKQWTKGGKDAVVITVKDSGEDNSFDHFTGVKLDGKELVKDVDYTVEKGSTVVTLKPETLEKLSVGEHTVTILFNNGEVNTTLTVLAASGGNATSPQTGDNSHMGLWIAIMILSLCALATTLFIGKKKRVFDR